MIPITVVFTGCINQQTSLGGPTLYIHGYHGTCSSAPCGGYSRLVSEQEYGKNAWQHGKTSSVAGSWDIMGCFLAMEGFSNLTKDCDWLVVWNMFYFSIYWECHHPNWLSYFVEGLKPPTRCEFKLILIYEMSFWSSISFKGKSVGITSTFGGNWVQHSSAWFPVYSIDCNFQQFSTMKKHMGIQHGDTLTINFGWCSPWWLNWRWWLRATPNEDMISVTQDWAIKYLGPLSSNGDIELAAARLARLMSERIKNFGGAQKQLQVYIYIIYIYII